MLTTGTYQRLPLAIKETFVPPTPFSNDQVAKTMSDFEDLIRYRLRMDEIVPPEMSAYRVADGRVHFHVPNLFDAAVCLRGARPDDGWFFVGVEFHLAVAGDVTATQGVCARLRRMLLTRAQSFPVYRLGRSSRC